MSGFCEMMSLRRMKQKGALKNQKKQQKCVLFIDATIHYNKKNIKNA
jgi:hypothetical protein